MSRRLPSGTVTFLFTDIEGSTRLLHELGPERYAEALAEHRRILRDAFNAHGGAEVDTQGDAFFVAFPTPHGALAAARQAREGLAEGPIRVRVGIHTGTPHLTDEGYVGVDVHRAARIAAAGQGGQVLVSASTAALLGADGLRDLGEHRLKDLSAGERIYQLGEEEFPPLKSLYRTNLPIPATPFLGRERELAEVGELLSQGDTRLLTLSGPGGTGKTRLGLQAAAETAERYPDGIFWVPLASLNDPELVLEAAAQVLGAKDGLAEHISDKSLLVLFDNFEHVIDASPGLGELLADCRNLRLLVTSRELLRIPPEQAYSVPPLEPQDGTELFVARARAVLPDFVPDDAVPDLCGRLEQLPLAIELAAARIRVLSPTQLLERLSQRLDLLKAGRGVDPRQQTLRATIEWSYALLNTDERELFARLAVFRGGCTLEVAEEVVQAELDLLQSLVDKSLVRVREGDRFWMLETIREFAAERLEESGEAEELRRRHAEHFLALAEEAYPHLQGDPKRWLDRLEAEHDNLRAALDKFEARGETQLALQMAGALSPFWYLRGHRIEEARRLDSALLADERPTAARARALRGATGVALDRGDVARARLLAEKALTLHRRLGDALGTAKTNFLLGFAAAEEREWGTAQQRFDESLRAFRALGEEHSTLIAIDLLALASFKLGDRDRALTLCEENLRRALATGDVRVEAKALGAMGFYLVDGGRVDEAVPLLIESTRIFRSVGSDFDEITLNLSSFARAAALTGSAETATQLLAAASSLSEEIGFTTSSYEADLNEETRALIRRRIDEATFAAAWEAGRKLDVDGAVELALNQLE